MPRLGLGLGLNLPGPVWLIGGESTPIIPSGFVARYLSSIVADMTLVTGTNLSQWDDQETGTPDNLTQATSGNQPTLKEYDVVTQSTLVEMPTLVDTGGGVLAMRFTTSQKFRNLTPPLQSSKWTIEVDMNFESANANNNFLLYNNNFDYLRIRNTELDFRLLDTRLILSYNETITRDRHKWVITYGDGTVKLYLNGTFRSQGSSTGQVSDGFGSFMELMDNQDLYNISFYSSVVADPANIIETPDFKLSPDTQYTRNDSDNPASVGDSISAWQSTTHKPYLNEIQKTSNNKYMGGYPTQAGDFSYVYAREKVDIQAQDKRIASSSTTSAEIGFDASEQLYMIADDGTRYTWTGVINDGTEGIYIPCREGNTLSVYEGATENATTFDVTGKAFTLDRWGASSLSSNGYSKEPVIYPFKLDQTQANYWSYLRNETGELIKIDGEYVVIS